MVVRPPFHRILIALSVAALMLTGGAAAGQVFYTGEFIHEVRDLQEPVSAVVLDDHTTLVLERSGCRVSMMSDDWTLLNQWGKQGVGPGELLFPKDMAAHNELIYIADSLNHRINVYQFDGTFVRSWGNRGTEAGQFNEPSAVAVSEDYVAVAEIGNDRVQLFDHAGRFIRSIGSRGTGDGQMRDPRDVAFTTGGSILIADSANHRISRFSESGTWEGSFGEFGPFVGLLDSPSNVMMTGDQVLVVDSLNHRMQWFDGAGTFVAGWGEHELTLHEGRGRVHYPEAVAISPDQTFALVCEPIENRVQIFTALPSGRLPKQVPSMWSREDETHLGDHLAADDNLLLTTDPDNHEIAIYKTDREVPVALHRSGERGERPGLFTEPAGVILRGSERRLIVTDPIGQNLHEFDITFDSSAPLQQWPHMLSLARAASFDRIRSRLPETIVPWPLEVTSAAAAANHHTYALDRRNCLVIELDDSYLPVAWWGGFGAERGSFVRPADIGISHDGCSVYVLDSATNRISIFDRLGALIRILALPVASDDEAGEFVGMEVVSDGSILVVNTSMCTVVRLDSNGSVIASFGSRGSDMGQMWHPRDVTVADDGRLFVIDQGNHRIQGFSAGGEWLVTFGRGRSYTRTQLPLQRRSN